ncbi:hypothetical protein YC2023_123279 [Brassica napus]
MADENNEMKEVKDEQELAPFDPTKKKKKKKVVIQDPIEVSTESQPEKSDSLPANDGLESSFAGLKKKKKPVEISSSLNEESLDAAEDLDGIFIAEHANDEEDAEGIDLQQQQRYPWEGSDRDYIYDELLGRVFNILRENNPELAGDRRRTVMRPPQVLREGTKKTVFVNFMDLCKTMHRQPDHVMNFLLAELGTSGSLDGQQRLVVKGRFAPKNFEGILRRYLSTSFALVARARTQFSQRRIVSSFSDAKSVDLDDLWRRLKLVLLLVLVAGRLEKVVGRISKSMEFFSQVSFSCERKLVPVLIETNITLPLYAAMNYQQTIGDMKPGKREREEAEEGRKGSAENTVPRGEYMHA